MSRFCDAIITINHEDYNNAKKMHCPNVYVIPSVGLDNKRFADVKTNRDEYRASFGVKPNDHMVLSVGELSSRKNQKIIVDALGMIDRKEQYVFVICGTAVVNSTIEEELKRKASELGVRIFLAGHRLDIPEINHCADVAVIPSIREGFGMTGVEALASGVLVVGSDVQGIREYVIPEKTGYLCDPYSPNQFADAIEKIVNLSPEVKKQMEELRQNCGEWKVEENAGVLPISLLSVQGELDQLLEEPPAQEVVDGILDFYFEVRDFLNISELVDDNYVVYTAFDENGRFYMKLFCVNPAENLQKCLDKGNSTVFFSATLLPLQYYRKMLSTRSENFGMYVESPFEQKKRCLMICRDVSSKYTRRGYEEYRKIAEYIARMSWQKKGNYMVFFPSYRLMEDVYQVYQDEFSVSWVRCISQHASMTELEREEFLEEFTEETEETLVGFCVMGGIFSEGIDLIGDRLIGAAVVGTGLPQVNCEREILKGYYDEKGEQGFDYAYRYPGMNKVLQAAGRVIRTKEDTGAILLMDERFLNRDYRNLFPREWNDACTCTLGNVEKHLQAFWDVSEENDIIC